MTNMDNFDSRALRYTDAFGQRFMRDGTYYYSLVTAGTGEIGDHPTYTIKTEKCGKGHKMQQHFVNIAYQEGEYKPNDPEITIQSGDLVTWSCRQPAAPPFEVVGGKEFFSSSTLVNECGYAHAFSAAGEYHWVDANGGKLSGVVRVSDPKCQSQKDIARWQRQLRKGALVMINGSKAEPTEIKITTGQTVYFAIIKSKGISITDQRCVVAANQACN